MTRCAEPNECPDSRCDWECRLTDTPPRSVVSDLLRHADARTVLRSDTSTRSERDQARTVLGLTQEDQ